MSWRFSKPNNVDVIGRPKTGRNDVILVGQMEKSGDGNE
jgi:hypothetical protein